MNWVDLRTDTITAALQYPGSVSLVFASHRRPAVSGMQRHPAHKSMGKGPEDRGDLYRTKKLWTSSHGPGHSHENHDRDR